MVVEDYNLGYLASTYHLLSDFKAHTVNYDGDEEDAGDVVGCSLEGFVVKSRLDVEDKAWWAARTGMILWGRDRLVGPELARNSRR